MKSLREDFEENYTATQVPAHNRKGFRIRYVYTGLWYRWTVEPGVLKKYKWGIGMACAAAAALFLGASLQYSPLNYARYVSLTGTLSIAALLFEVIGVVQFLAAGRKVTGMTFRDMDAKLRIAPVIHSILLVCTAVLGIGELILEKLPVQTLGIPVLYLLAGACSGTVFALYRRLPWTKEK